MAAEFGFGDRPHLPELSIADFNRRLNAKSCVVVIAADGSRKRYSITGEKYSCVRYLLII